jgi:hypothetical protein
MSRLRNFATGTFAVFGPFDGSQLAGKMIA